MEGLGIFYKGAAGTTHEIYWASWDGKNWHGNDKIKDTVNPQTSYSTPGSAVLNNITYVVYKGALTNDLWMMWQVDGKWYGNKKIKDMPGGIHAESKTSPQLATYRNHLVMVYLRPDSDELHYAWFDGSSWFDASRKADGTPVAGGEKVKVLGSNDAVSAGANPSMAVLDNKLYIVYKGTDSSQLWLSWLDADQWHGDQKIYIGSDFTSTVRAEDSPGLAQFDNHLYMVYRPEGKALLISTAWFDKKQWHGGTTIKSQLGNLDVESEESPAAANFNGNLHIVYRDTKKDMLAMAVLSQSNKTWTGNEKIKDMPGDINPKSSGSPAICVIPQSPRQFPDWMSKLPETMLISEINIPGSHDAASINEYSTTPYACHNRSITAQLMGGVRLLDVRIRFKKKNNAYTFVTCHGKVSMRSDKNEYQSLTSLLDECKQFLAKHGKETIIVSLKYDDGLNTDDNDMDAFRALQTLLDGYDSIVYKGDVLPTLKQVQGKMVFFDRMRKLAGMGIPLRIIDDTRGEYAPDAVGRSFKVYTQDRYQNLNPLWPEAEKFEYVREAIRAKKPGEVGWNFASSTRLWIVGVYIHPWLLNYLGTSPAGSRQKHIGWILIDYPFSKFPCVPYLWTDLVSVIISSNFDYEDYPLPFFVVG